MEKSVEDQKMTDGLRSFVSSIAGGMIANSAIHPEIWDGAGTPKYIVAKTVGALAFTASAVYFSHRVSQ